MVRRSRYIISFVVILVSGSCIAQPALTTYYVIPPSDSCDGIWAFGPAAELFACPPPYTYYYEPFGCAPWGTMTYSGDTVFMPLCSFPCTFSVWWWNMNDADTCSWVATPLSVAVPHVRPSVPVIGFAPNPASVEHPLVRLYFEGGVGDKALVVNAMGLLVRSLPLKGGSRGDLDLTGLPAGTYWVTVYERDRRLVTQPVMIQ